MGEDPLGYWMDGWIDECMYVCDADRYVCMYVYSFSPAMIHTYIHTWMINIYIDR
jgi:hypothetical protein